MALNWERATVGIKAETEFGTYVIYLPLGSGKRDWVLNLDLSRLGEAPDIGVLKAIADADHAHRTAMWETL